MTMISWKSFVPFSILLAFFVFLWNTSIEGTLRYKKETEKKCTFCHTGIPQPGDEDPQLNQDGKKFKDNGYKLTPDQEQRDSYVSTR